MLSTYLESLDEIVLLDDRASGDVDDDRRLLHLLEDGLVEGVLCLGGQRAGDDQHVSCGHLRN